MQFYTPKTFKRSTLVSLVAAALSFPTLAQTTAIFNPAEKIAYYSLSQAIANVGNKFNVVIVAPSELTHNVHVQQLHGEYTIENALSSLLKGTGLMAERSSAGAFIIKKDAQKAQSNKEADIQVSNDIEKIQIYTERLANDLNSLARSVSVIDRQTLETQFSAAPNIAEVLAKVVPGMAPPTPALTNFGTTLRGRNALVLIDGVPMNTNRNISRDLHNLHPSQIERVEVFRGGNSLYGSGASGGVIYIYTKSGQQVQQAQTLISAKTSLQEIDTDAMSYSVAQSVSGEKHGWFYRLGASYEAINGFYDADGERLAPEPSQGDNFDSEIMSFDFKVSKSWDNQTLSFATMAYMLDQDSEYASDPSVNELAYIHKAQGLKGLSLDKQTEINNLVLNLKYQNQLTDAHTLNAQVYYRDYDSRFSPFDARHIASWNHLAQTYLTSTNLGARFTMQSKLSDSIHLDYGFDAQDERSESPVTTYDGDIYDQSQNLVFKATGDKTFVPELTHATAAVFVQLRACLSDHIGVEGGLRHERIDASFDSFKTLGQQTPIQGSSFDYDSTFYNLGVSYDINDDHTLYIASNEGYALPDIGLRIRSANDQFDLSKSKLQPVETTDYEIGYRGGFGPATFDFAYYQSGSDLGGVTGEGFGLALRRDKIKIDGFELTTHLDVTDAISAKFSYTQVNGEEKREGQVEYNHMNGFSIPPSKLVASVHADLTDTWHSSLTAMHSASEDFRIDGENAWGRREVKGYTLLDWHNQITLSQGKLLVGIENILNKSYFPLYSQLQRNGRNSSSVPGRGRTLSVQYQLDW